jgi:polar amino acid transport system permease protein
VRADDIAELKLRDVAHARRPVNYSGWILWALTLLITADFLWVIAHNKNFEWSVVGQWFTAESIMRGLSVTLGLTVVAMLIGVILGLFLAIARLSETKLLVALSSIYIWFFRGTPLLLQLLIWFNLALVFPRIGIPGLFEARMVDVMTPFVATLLGLGINQGAYTAEVVRSGILSVDVGQTEAAKSIGMTRLTTLRRIILPQAMRVIIPPVGNEVISMVKLTSIASVIGYAEVLRNAQTIYYANARVIELLIVAAAWYLMIVTVLSVGQHFLERYFAKGQTRRKARAAARPAVEG